MNEPEWREVRISSDVFDTLINALGDAGFHLTDAGLVREILDDVERSFREDWSSLHETPDGLRSYRYPHDVLPYLMFYGRPDETVMYDFAIVEEIVTVFFVDVVGFEQPLEDPDDPTPDR